MASFARSESELLEQVLKPLLRDYQDWFERSRARLQSGNLPSIAPEERERWLERVEGALSEVQAARSLFEASGKTVGVEVSTLMEWHRLAIACWQLERRSLVSRAARPSGRDQSLIPESDPSRRQAW